MTMQKGGSQMMKVFVFLGLALLIMALAMPAAAKMPKSLAGITLGEDLKSCQGMVQEDSKGVAEDYPYLNEVTIPPGKIPGVRLGKVAYGNCADPGKVVRIKLKLGRPDRDLFKELKKLYTQKWGDPGQYRGDPFQNVVAWKWSFKDGDAKVSLILSNSRDPEEGPGNRIKMTLTSMMAQERKCWQKKHPYRFGGKGGAEGKGRFDIMNLVPQ
jgi:hypothetical protein